MRGVVWCTVSLFYFTVSDFFVLICYAFHVVLCCCSLYDFNHLVAFEINFQALVSFWYLGLLITILVYSAFAGPRISSDTCTRVCYITCRLLQHLTGMVWYGVAEFNVPLDTV